MPNWIRDSGGRLVKRDTPHNKELELSLNIMEATPEDQHSHHGHRTIPMLQINEGHASTSYECTIMYSAPYRAASDQTAYCSTSTNFPWDGNHNACLTMVLILAIGEYFYDGMSSSMKQLLETMCGGDFMSKIRGSYGFLELCAEVSRGWDEPNKGEVGKMNYDKKIGGARTEKDVKCKLLLNTSATKSTSVPTAGQPSQQSSSLEQAIVNLSKDGWMQNDLSQKIDNLQYSISRLTNLNTVQEKGRFPSQPHQNPKGIHEVEIMRENLHSHDWRKGSGKALLDLGASVNLLPYSVYKQLGLGELKPTSITLSLADRSVKIPRGKLICSYHPWKAIPCYSNAIINCRNGLMQLTFGNMTLELNIFYMSKKQITPEEEEGPEEVCIIDTLVEEHCNQNMQDKLNESLGILKKGC
ncbi:hypothetical protein CK203_061487 [Vitis vinifera]|uniref:Uncharacterized protein n=1 Tax=Vitis vinifera TaxID=29760 RepID=A0A438GFS3_VITVI|nr:hypothetical protein CK203_061487 [Vitis vinifera]